MTFTVETGTGSATANSYVAVADADTYHSDGHLYATSWTGAGSSDKQKALVMATRLLDENVEWLGYKRTDTQKLMWPRYEMYDRGGWSVAHTTIPADLKNATAELARWLIDYDRTSETDDVGFKKLKAGPVEIEVDKSDRRAIIPVVVARMIAPYGRVIGGGSIKLLRG